MSTFLLRWLQGRELTRKLKPLHDQLAVIKQLQGQFAELSDADLRGRLLGMRAEAQAAGFNEDKAIPVAFALLREAIRRVLGVTPYDTQVLAGLALYRGCIVEMGTGEGKTLTAPFAAYAHWTFHRRQVHVVTANDYLAQRDASMLLPLYQWLNLPVGVSSPGQSRETKRIVYTCPVVYGTHKALAQDYLNDHLARSGNEAVMPRALGAVIVDEADAALIDEARTPIVLSAPRPAPKGLYEKLAAIACALERSPDADGEGDFWVDGKDRSCLLTERGYERANEELVKAGLLAADEPVYGDSHQALLHKLTSALAVQHVLFKDQHYVVRDGAIVLVDELTGRLVPGQRWDAGLHQALEAKEGLPVSPESTPLARITLQHFFRQYQVVSGMTGTAMDDANELQQVYGLTALGIPANKPSQRIDEDDRFYRTQAAKLDAVVLDISAAHLKGQPVLIGTASVEQSAELSARLKEAGLPHEVLNASQHGREAEIIAGAGAPGAITVSTNMAGRGVDIVLGGSVQLDVYRSQMAMGLEMWNALGPRMQASEIAAITAQHALRALLVRQAGGLRVIGLERYESRRQDRQLRGRCARQGDPGQTVFYLSLEDSLIENFAGERIRTILAMLDVAPGDEFESALVKKAVDAAQREVEGRAQAARRQLMDYEGVLDSQRKVIYGMREELLHSAEIEELLERLVGEEAQRLASKHLADPDYPETWDIQGLREELTRLGITLSESDELLREREFKDLALELQVRMQTRRLLRLAQVPETAQVPAMRFVSLDVFDRLWIYHLDALDQLRQGIDLRQHAKVDPKQAYAKEAFERFDELLTDLRSELVRTALSWVAQPAETPEAVQNTVESEPVAGSQ